MRHQVAGGEQLHLSRRERAAIVLQKQFRMVQARRVLKSKALNLAWDLIEYYDGAFPLIGSKWESQLLAGGLPFRVTYSPCAHATREEERKRRRPNRRPAPAPDGGASEAAA